MSADAGHPSQHPAPHRARVSTPLMLLGLAIGPAAWIAQLTANYGLSSLACFPHDSPARQSPPPGWALESANLLSINLACLALAAGGLILSFAHWRRTRGERGGDAHRAINIGEGRTRFLSLCGVIASAGFAVAILFDTTVILGVPACWSIAP